MTKHSHLTGSPRRQAVVPPAALSNMPAALSNMPAALSSTTVASGSMTRRSFLRRSSCVLASGLVTSAGCIGDVDSVGGVKPDLIWGRRGLSDGRLLKPRAIAIDAEDQLYLVDTTGRLQVFDVDGNFLRGWKMPLTEFGRPTGLSIDSEQRLLVADTHYFRMLVFSREGHEMAASQIGGISGKEPGQFAFVTDAVRDRSGNYYIGEYGDSDRIQRFDPSGKFIDSWGGTGRETGKFVRPQSLVLSADETELWVADACNHRIQVFDLLRSPVELKRVWGVEGGDPGQLYYPYDLVIASDQTIYVCEYGNQRVQQFSPDGQPLRILGAPGHGEGQFYQPWGLVLDSQQRLHVLDSNNHRVQRFTLA
jgi:sugar lactone lactonase YvrE